MKDEKKHEKSPMNKILTANFSVGLLLTGALLLISFVVAFIWKDFDLSFSDKIQADKIGQFGDVVGGLVGSIWALAGVIMFYVALKEQGKDFKTNRDLLVSQSKALELQIKEFQLQREELEATRIVHEKQQEILAVQQFENSFFQLLKNYSDFIDNYSEKSGKTGGREILRRYFYSTQDTHSKYFEFFEKELTKNYQILNYLPIFRLKKSEFINHLIGKLIHILKFIDTFPNFTYTQKEFYVDTVLINLMVSEKYLFKYIFLHREASEKKEFEGLNGLIKKTDDIKIKKLQYDDFPWFKDFNTSQKANNLKYGSVTFTTNIDNKRLKAKFLCKKIYYKCNIRSKENYFEITPDKNEQNSLFNGSYDELDAQEVLNHHIVVELILIFRLKESEYKISIRLSLSLISEDIYDDQYLDEEFPPMVVGQKYRYVISQLAGV